VHQDGGVCLQPIILDARGHLLGRLAAIVAKTTLQGEFCVLYPIHKQEFASLQVWKFEQ